MRTPSQPREAAATAHMALKNRQGMKACLLALALLALPFVVLAQAASASYQLSRQSIDGGAGPAISPSYSLDGTIGQPDAGATLRSQSYTLRGGFHPRGSNASDPDRLFRDGFEAQ